MDNNSLYDLTVVIETEVGNLPFKKYRRTAGEILQDIDHFRFIAPLGSTLNIKVTESK